jgi:isomerase DpgB
MTEEILRVDGTVPVSGTTVAALQAFCDSAEQQHDGPGAAIVEVSGAPGATDGRSPHRPDADLVVSWENALCRLERLPRITVAVAAGDCGGAALEVLLATDFRIAAPDVRLLAAGDSECPEYPGMALFRLTRQYGGTRIPRAVLLGAPIDADAALALGLVHEVADDPAAAVAAFEASTAPLSGPEPAVRRRLMADASSTSFEDALGAHLAACDRSLGREAAL